MDNVKASVNIKDGLIQLEGPQEFVEKYLNQYKELIAGLSTVTSTDKSSEQLPKEETKDKPRKRRPRTKTGPTATQKVQELLDEGYFKQPKTRADVQAEILNKGVKFESKEVSAALNNFFNSSKLKRTGAGKTAQYYTNA